MVALDSAFDNWASAPPPEPRRLSNAGAGAPPGRKNSKTPLPSAPPAPAADAWGLESLSAWLGIPGTEPQQQQPKSGERRRHRPPGSPGPRGTYVGPPRPGYGLPPGYGAPPPGYGSPIGVGPYAAISPYAPRPGYPTSPRGPLSPRPEGRYSQRAPARASPVNDSNDWTSQVGAWLTAPVSDVKL